MKKFFMIAVMAVAALTASAQQEAGTFALTPRIGVGMSIFKDCAVGGEKIDNNVSMAVGLEAQYQCSENFGISAGVDYDYYMGPEKKVSVSLYGVTINGDYTVKVGYVDIPVMLHLNFGGFGIAAGVQPGFKVNGTCGDVNVINLKSTKFDVPLELSYSFGNNIIGVRYNLPISKAYEFEGLSPKISGVMLTYGYRIDL